MTASELFKQGSLDEAIQAQTAEVKADPGDHGKRLFLFEMLAFSGDLERAKKQIEAIKYDEVELDTAVANYKRAVAAEEARRKLFDGGVAPEFLGDAPEHATLRLQAIQALRDNQAGEAAELLAKANEKTPQLSGMLNNKPFKGIRDCDDILGGVLEVLANGHYLWVPLEQVESLAMNPPKFPRDLLWFPARLELLSRVMGEIFIPVLYPNSFKSESNELKLGRLTEFSETEPVTGSGSKLFLVGDDAAPLLEFRELTILHPEDHETGESE